VRPCAKVLYLGIGLKSVGKRFPYWGRSTTVKLPRSCLKVTLYANSSNKLKLIVKHLEKNLAYVEGTLDPSISLLKRERDIMPTPQGWERNYAYL
jgi:hypothetical protein